MRYQLRHSAPRAGIFAVGIWTMTLTATACSSNTLSSANPPSAAPTISTQSSHAATLSTVAASSAPPVAAVAACQDWQSIEVKGVAAAVAAPLRQTAAHEVGAQPSGLSTAMLEVAQLPNTGLTPDQLTTAVHDRATIKSDCAALGVTISS
jgi:hypothetical protein